MFVRMVFDWVVNWLLMKVDILYIVNTVHPLTHIPDTVFVFDLH